LKVYRLGTYFVALNIERLTSRICVGADQSESQPYHSYNVGASNSYNMGMRGDIEKVS